MMIELNGIKLRQPLSLFDGIDHSEAVVHGVLEGRNAGRVFVDREPSPTAALLATADHFFYFAGDPENTAFNRAAKQIILGMQHSDEDKSAVLFSFTDRWRAELDSLFVDCGVFRIERSVFTFDGAKFRSFAPVAPLPAGFTLQPIDGPVAEQLKSGATWGGTDGFLAGGVGQYAAAPDGALAGACFTVYSGRGQAELALFTEEPYRRMGIATHAAAAVIRRCQSRGLLPAWSCWSNNLPSARLARSLCFQNERILPAHFYCL